MSKQDTVNKYVEDYLRGKSDEKRAEFFSKSPEKQYSCIMAWKRRNELRQPAEITGLPAQTVLKHTQALADMIEMTENFNAKEYMRMQEALAAAKERLDNYYKIKNGKELRELEKAQEELQRRIDRLRAEGTC